MQKQQRLESLDWLRGIMALSIMFYHLKYWIYYPVDSQSILGRLGIYGVSIFFVLSGLSMAIVYNKKISSLSTIIDFFTRRIFRIWPLLWVVSILILLPSIVKTGYIDWKLIFLNLTTLFGFIKPTAYIATGAWSIGNEMVYYAFTPVVFMLYNFKKSYGNIFSLICLAVGFIFAFKLLDANISIAEQWSTYINPFNNLFLYVSGISIYYNFKNIKIKQIYNSLILVLAICLFCIIPFSGDQIIIVTGMGRVYFSIISVVIVFCFYKMQINNIPKPIANCLEKFGIATYGIYLIHPVVYSYLGFVLKRFNINSQSLFYISVCILTTIFALLSYKLFELKFINLGKKILITKSTHQTKTENKII